MFKIPMKFADVFVLAIDAERELIRYTVRDKDTGILLEPERTTRFIINENMVHFDARFVEIGLFNRAYQVLA